MSFEVSADAYGRFMGRYSEPLAPLFADLAGVTPGQRVLDVGCGPGALAAELVRRLGPAAVCAVEPSASFAAAVRERLPGVEVCCAAAEELPLPDDCVDAALAQLVVHFMADPVAGLREMARVTRPGGVVAACVWDYHGGRSPMTPFWRAVHHLDPAAPDGTERAGTSADSLSALFAAAGLASPQVTSLTVSTSYATFGEWWDTLTLGIGPAGEYLNALPPERREALRTRAHELMPTEPIRVSASVWAARSTV